MNRVLVLSIVAVAGLAVLAGCIGAQTHDGDDMACTCEGLRAGNTGWCDHCNVGYVSGNRTECRNCVAANGMCAACSNQ